MPRSSCLPAVGRSLSPGALGACLLAAWLSGCAGKLTSTPVFPARTAWVASGDEWLVPPLASDAARLFAVGRAGTLRALDRTTGAVVWSLAGRAGRVSAGEGLVVLRQEDGTIWGLDPATGETRWQAATGVTGPLPAAVDAGKVVIAGDGAACLEAASGKTLWSSPPASRSSAPPVLSGPWVFLGGEDGGLRCLDAATGVLLWTYASGAALAAPPLLDERQRVLLGTTARRVVALRAAKRGEERWRWKVGADVRDAPALHGDLVLLAAYDAVLYAIDRGNGHMAWRAPLPSRPASGPLLLGGAVLVACHEKEIVGFDARTGKRLGGLTLPAGLQAPPLLVGDWLYVGLRDRSLLALRLGTEAAGEPSPRP